MFEKLISLMVLTVAPFGTWESPITTEEIVRDTVRFYEMHGDETGLYWTELHPKEKGRLSLTHASLQDLPSSLLPEVSVRTRVHEYGGGAFLVHHGDITYSNDADKQLYRFEGEKQMQLTHSENRSYADGTVHSVSGAQVWVAEEGEENFLVYLAKGKEKILTSGHDFYSNPRFSPDGKKLAFITWDFPNMQWDSSTLWLADIDEEGNLFHLKPVAGGPDESVCDAQWSPAGKLHYICDKTGFWNLYREGENLSEKEAEFGTAPWIFGRTSYAFLPNGRIICSYAIKGVDHVGELDPKTKTLTDFDLPYTLVQNLVAVGEKIYFIGAGPTQPSSLIALDPKTKKTSIIKASFSFPFGEEWIAKPQLISYPSLNGKTGYGFYYPPQNPNYSADVGERPPLIVKVHGGPTARAYPYFTLETQFWTSRGFAFVEVNYGGSTGYGREYFKRLEKQWGVLDVFDCISAAKTLAEKGLADPDRLLIRGGSSGGYTVLAALAFHDVFAAGTSYYGICDLELLYDAPHKFESKYTDLLVGTYPEEKALIRERSPIHHLEKYTTPTLLLQGEQDKIVPPNQSINIFEALKERGVPVGIILFADEGHGFRRSESIKQSLTAELYFYTQILGISQETQTPPFQLYNQP